MVGGDGTGRDFISVGGWAEPGWGEADSGTGATGLLEDNALPSPEGSLALRVLQTG